MKNNSLSYYWSAIFNENTIINQFDNDGNDRSFEEFKSKSGELAYFILCHIEKDIEFIVDFVHKIVYKNSDKQKIIYIFKDQKSASLQYKRRHNTKFFLKNLEQFSDTISYLIELQFETKKIIVIIDNEGEYKIEET